MTVHPAWQYEVDRPVGDTAAPSVLARFRVFAARAARVQSGRVFLWAPVALAAGVAIYFCLPREPGWPAVGAAAVASGLCFHSAARARAAVAWLLIGLVLAGLCLAKARMEWVRAPVLPASSSGQVQISGWVERMVSATRSNPRLIVRVDEIKGLKPEAWPARVQLTLFKVPRMPVPGEFITVDGRLFRLPGPVTPGGYDHARTLWFQGIGATGRGRLTEAGVGPVKPDRWTWRRPVDDLRARINRRIEQALPRQTAGFAIALITGDRSLVTRAQRDQLAVAGLAHVLAISGLHMSLVAGGVFWLVRALLAMFPAVSLNRPIKKWAAAAGVLAGAGYLLLSGSGIATQRAFIMLLIMLLAIVVDRPAISLRNLAVAAVLVIVLAPEAVMSASFHMSFMAVMGLIAAYEGVRDRRARHFEGRTGRRRRWHPVARWIGIALAGLAFTTLVAGAFSGLPAAYHFNRVAPYSLLANILALPVVSMIVMPGAVAGILAMPLGLEAAPLWVMGQGLDHVLNIANMVADYDGASLTVSQMSLPATLAAVFGAVWLCLIKGPVRWAGAALAVLALVLSPSIRQPDIYIEAAAKNVALRNGQGELAFAHARRGRFSAERWLRNDGDDVPLKTAAQRPGWMCQASVCRGQSGGRTIVYAMDGSQLPANCFDAWIVIAQFPLRGRCRKAQLRIDRIDVWTSGTHVIYMPEASKTAEKTNPEMAQVEPSNQTKTSRAIRSQNQSTPKPVVVTAQALRGDRPWVSRPIARKHILTTEQPKRPEPNHTKPEKKLPDAELDP